MMDNIKKRKFQEILTTSFTIKSFVIFSKEFFNDIKLIAPDNYQKVYSNFSFYVDGYTHIGNYLSDDRQEIAILAVCLNRGNSVERARGIQRNFVKSLIQQSNCAGAIVAFYTKEDKGKADKWRLSFIRLEYEFSKSSIVEKLTPAKRYSYLVGKNEPCHTAQERLFPIFSNDDRNPTIEEIEDAFSVEAVTKEFFDKYKEKYYELHDFLDKNEEFLTEAEIHNFTSEQFAKKLMGQIVFLYFIQKKGWLGVSAIPTKMSEKEYKNSFFKKGAKSREIIGNLYVAGSDGIYRLDRDKFSSISAEDEEFLAGIVVGEPWGSGPTNFMRETFKGCIAADKNYFNDYLEPLFYTGLNKKRGENNFYQPMHRRIPFLNGGLFEPLNDYAWMENNFNIPNSLFSNVDAKGLEADGILDIFDRYNFTMNEDEPMEQEVAIDPEMLGKVFENLLEVRDRKSKGAFYTPREIVHYMCQETLISHITNKTELPENDVRDLVLYGDLMRDEDTTKDAKAGNKELLISSNIFDLNTDNNRLEEIDNILATVKVCDPAVGSGAFPLGMVNEIVKLREILSEYMSIGMNDFNKKQFYAFERNPYKLKTETIKNCIFACDIEPSAVDIAKLRLWLSIVIDDSTTATADITLNESTQPRQLPNLDCNIICGDSLVDEFNGIPLITESKLLNNLSDGQMSTYQSGFDILLTQLIELQDKLYFTKDHDDKEEIKTQIQDIYDRIILQQLGDKVNNEEYYEFMNKPSKPFVIWQLYFPKVFRDNSGFDIVIGNPPYIGEEGHKDLFRKIASTHFGKKYYLGKMDFWYFFTSKGIELLKDKGVLSFIAPNNWMTTAGGKNMRKHIATSVKIKNFITFNDVMIFDTASQQTMIFLLEKNKMIDSYTMNFKAIGNRQVDSNLLSKFLNSTEIGNSYKALYDPITNKDGRTIQFLKEDVARVLSKINALDRDRLNKDEIMNGIHTHHSFVTKKMLPLLPESSNVNDGIFVLTNEEIVELNLSTIEKQILKPYYDSLNIGRYYFNISNKYMIIYTESKYKNPIYMDDYPQLKSHLDFYSAVITSDNRPYGLHRAKDAKVFEGEKIISVRKCSKPSFSYVPESAYVGAEYEIISTSRYDLKYLTCLFNSSLVKFWLLKMGKMQGKIFQVDKEPLLTIPLVKPSEATLKEVLDIYDKISERKLNAKDSDISDLEILVDNIIFSAYSLATEDISIIKAELDDWERK